MPIIPEDWTPIAKTLGYETELAMLQDLYEVQGFSLYELADRLGYSHNNVRRRLILNHIAVRTRGGKNNLGKRLLTSFTDEQLTDEHAVAKKAQVHISTVFAEKRRRKKENPTCSSQSSPQPPTSKSSAENLESDESNSLSPNTASNEAPTSITIGRALKKDLPSF